MLSDVVGGAMSEPRFTVEIVDVHQDLLEVGSGLLYFSNDPSGTHYLVPAEDR